MGGEYIPEGADDPTAGELGMGPPIARPDSSLAERQIRDELRRDPQLTPPSDNPGINVISLFAKLRRKHGDEGAA